jgi:hypothetical protein
VDLGGLSGGNGNPWQSAALEAVTPGAVVTQRAGVPRFLDRLAVTGGATDAVVAGGIKTQGAATALLDRAAGVATARRNAVAPGAVVAERATAHLRKGLHRLLG